MLNSGPCAHGKCLCRCQVVGFYFINTNLQILVHVGSIIGDYLFIEVLI